MISIFKSAGGRGALKKDGKETPNTTGSLEAAGLQTINFPHFL